MALQPPEPMSLPQPGASTSPPAVKKIKGLKQPRIATPRPALTATKGTGSVNPFSANKMTIKKTASLSEFRHQQVMRKMAASDPMAFALLTLREEQEKEAGLMARGLDLTGRVVGGIGKAIKSTRVSNLGAKASGAAQKRFAASSDKLLNQAARAEELSTTMVGPAHARKIYKDRSESLLSRAENMANRAQAAGSRAAPPAPKPKVPPQKPKAEVSTPAAQPQAKQPAQPQAGQQTAQQAQQPAPRQGNQQTAQPKADTAQQTAAQVQPGAKSAPSQNGTIGEAAGGGMGWRGKLLAAGAIGTGGVAAGGAAVGGFNAAQNQNRLALQQGYNQGVR